MIIIMILPSQLLLQRPSSVFVSAAVLSDVILLTCISNDDADRCAMSDDAWSSRRIERISIEGQTKKWRW